MLGTDPPTDYDDDAQITTRQWRKLERTLKAEIAENMIWAQYNRSKGDSPNGYARRGVIDNARTLRTLLIELDMPECSDPVIERSMFDTETISKIEYDGERTVKEILESLHETGSKPEV